MTSRPAPHEETASLLIQLLPIVADIRESGNDNEDLDLYLIHSLIMLGVIPVDIEDPNGNRPPHLCAQRGRVLLLRDIVERKGACLRDKNHNGNTVLHTACWFGHLNVVEWLLAEENERIVDIHATNHSESTPLHLACYRGFPRIAQLLIDHGSAMTQGDSTFLTRRVSLLCLSSHVLFALKCSHRLIFFQSMVIQQCTWHRGKVIWTQWIS